MYFSDQIPADQNSDAYKKLLLGFAELVRDVVNFAWNAWSLTERKSFTEQKYYPATVLALTRHICESLDGVSVLAEQGCPEPCKPLLRSAFEAALGIEYVLESDSERRGLAYQVAHANRQIKLYRKIDPNEQSGKQLRAELASDPLAAGLNWPGIDTKPLISNLENMLKRPEYQPIQAEWEAAQSMKKSDWFSLFDGPRDIRGLADHLKRLAMYEFLYRHWSNAVHAGDCFSNIAGKPGQISIRPIRHPDGLQAMVCWTVGICLIVNRLLLHRWGTEEQQAEARADYVARIHPRFNELRKGELIVVPWK